MPRPRKYTNNTFAANQAFGQWKISNPAIVRDAAKRSLVECTCSCGTKELVACHHVVSGKSTRCKKCNENFRRMSANPNWRGAGIVGKSVLTQLSSSVTRKGAPFNISSDYANSLLVSSGQACAFTGQFISPSDDSARLVALNASVGYVPGNVAWVHTSVAPSLKNSSPNEFIDMCLKVAQQHQFINKGETK